MRVPVLGPVVGAYQITATRLALVWRSALLALVAGYLLTLLDYSKLDPIARTAAIRPEDMLGPDAEVYLLLVPMAAAFIVLAANASRHWQQLVVDTARTGTPWFDFPARGRAYLGAFIMLLGLSAFAAWMMVPITFLMLLVIAKFAPALASSWGFGLAMSTAPIVVPLAFVLRLTPVLAATAVGDQYMTSLEALRFSRGNTIRLMGGALLVSIPLMLAVTLPMRLPMALPWAFHVFGAIPSAVSGPLFGIGLFLGIAVFEAYLALVYVEVARIRDAKPV